MLAGRLCRAVFWIFVLALSLISCNKADKDSFQGYAEGEYLYVASSEAGRLDKLMVSRGETVEANTPLFVLEHENETAEVRQAQEQLRAAKAQLEDINTGKRQVELNIIRAQLDQAVVAERLSASQLMRDEGLSKIDAISKEQLDTSRATHQRDQAKMDELLNQVKSGELPGRQEQIRAQAAKMKAAEAALAQTRWRLSQKFVSAPKTALVFDTVFVEGEWVPAGTPVVSLLPPGNIKVRFFVPEETMGGMKAKQAVTIHCDGCLRDVPGQITYISPGPEYTPP
ncbi:MAG: HlyD family secretion protein, partial [Nitrospiria bacterium]